MTRVCSRFSSFWCPCGKVALACWVTADLPLSYSPFLPTCGLLWCPSQGCPFGLTPMAPSSAPSVGPGPRGPRSAHPPSAPRWPCCRPRLLSSPVVKSPSGKLPRVGPRQALLPRQQGAEPGHPHALVPSRGAWQGGVLCPEQAPQGRALPRASLNEPHTLQHPCFPGTGALLGPQCLAPQVPSSSGPAGCGPGRPGFLASVAAGLLGPRAVLPPVPCPGTRHPHHPGCTPSAHPSDPKQLPLSTPGAHLSR